MKRGLVLGALTLAVAVTPFLSSCNHAIEPTAGLGVADDQGPGTLIQATPMADVDQSVKALGATAMRITYRSTSAIDSSITQVTGTAFVPAGKPPHDGWPTIALAHGTTGINQECAPSQSGNLFGSIGLVAGYLQLGYAVAATDYQGLGGPGHHPYLDAKTAGYNVIDSVRALRVISKDVGRKWGAFGGSQGGAVSWAANEQADVYAPDLNLVGSVSLAPIADVTALPGLAANRQLSIDQMGVYIWALMGLERTRPDFDITPFRHGLAEREWTALAGCNTTESIERLKVFFRLTPDDLVPTTPEDAARLEKLFQSMAVPHRRASAPMLVIYGGSDTYVNFEWTRAAIEEACQLGSIVAAVFQPDRGHNDLDPSQFSGYLMARFDGLPAPSTC